MPSSTFRTIMGFFRSVLARRIPSLRKEGSLEGIYNYQPVDNRVATSGQPDESQLIQIVNAGYQIVINLAPTSTFENSVVEERSILEDCGANYVHIPVDFKNPTESDFLEFRKTMELHETEKVWVHCAANMRVSAFIYRYRRSVLGHETADAKADLHKIWEPFGAWKDLIEHDA